MHSFQHSKECKDPPLAPGDYLQHKLAVQKNSTFKGNKKNEIFMKNCPRRAIVTSDSSHTRDQTAKSDKKMPCSSVPWLGNYFLPSMYCHDVVNHSQDYKPHPAGKLSHPQLAVQKVSQGIKAKLGIRPIGVWVCLFPENIYDKLYIYNNGNIYQLPYFLSSLISKLWLTSLYLDLPPLSENY